MRSRPEAGSTDQDWGEKRAQNMGTVDNDGAKQAVLRSVDEIFNVRRATRKISHPSHSLYETFKSVPVFFLQSINQSKVVYCSPNLQNEFAVHVQSSDKRGNPKERTVSLAGSPSFTISLRCITNKVVFVNTYLKKTVSKPMKRQ